MSFGEELRRERELRQISLREIAHATKINLRYLEAMERNDFAYLPGGLFNRGFVRAYCEHIGVDSEAMVNAYLLEERVQAGSRTDGAREGGLLRGREAARGADRGGAATEARRKRDPRRRRWLLVVMLAVAVIAAGAFVMLWALDGFAGVWSDASTGRPSHALPGDSADRQPGRGASA